MTDSIEAEVAVLKEKLTRLEGWRYRVLDVIPLAIFVALIVVALNVLIGMEHRLTSVETKLDIGFAELNKRLDKIEPK